MFKKRDPTLLNVGHCSFVQVKSYTGPDRLGEALYGCNLVLIPAGVPRKPGMTRDDLFNINAGTCLLAETWCPDNVGHVGVVEGVAVFLVLDLSLVEFLVLDLS